ncbi:MAG: protein kinase [Kofleriaceae bacterium]
MNPPEAIAGQRVVGEPSRLRHEIAWPIELPDGRRAVIAQLVPELAAQPALRRRWVADMERVAALPAAFVAATLKLGPEPDPRAAGAEPPWRVRLDPDGPTLDRVLARAPLPVDEALDLGARLADVLQAFHAAGGVLRDLDPRAIVCGHDRQLWLTDIGHARLSILSSRTASSLLLESSPYVASEALLGTVVDARADLYSLGVVLWRALTGRVPFEASLLARRGELPPLVELRPEIPAPFAELVTRCLASDPDQRPSTARDVADALRGRGTPTSLVVTRVCCQACGATMRAGLRLCLACGKQAVQFHRTGPDDPDATSIVLQKSSDAAAFLGKLHAFYDVVGETIPRLNFVVGDRRMYSKTELARRHHLPAVLLADLAPETAATLVARLRADGFKVKAITVRQRARQSQRATALVTGGVAAGLASLVAIAAGGVAAAFGAPVLCVGGGALAIGLVRRRQRARAAKRRPVGELRAAPAALPASDELVAGIAATLAAAASPDVRVRLEELAALVQRLCDARAVVAEGDQIVEPVRPLVELARSTATAIEAVDHQLATLDEGALVRALARAEARGEASTVRVDLLAGLDTLRQLEEQRGKLFGRMLEITSLARVAIERGLAEAAAVRCDDLEIAHALHLLDT